MLFRLLLDIPDLLRQLLQGILVGRVLELELCGWKKKNRVVNFPNSCIKRIPSAHGILTLLPPGVDL